MRAGQARCVVVGLAIATMPAWAQRADAPVVRAGDEWSFVVWYTVPSTTPNRVWTVRSVSPRGIDATENGEPLSLTPELNVLDSPRQSESNPGALRFPLEVGRSWRYRTDWLFKPKRSKGSSTVDVEVVAYERVAVPAGQFDAFRLEMTAKLEGTSPIGSRYDGETVTTYWYAPAARAVVKWVSRNPYLGPSTVELVAMRPAR
jgi:hypothetical protein